MNKMEEVSLPAPPDGYKYKLVREKKEPIGKPKLSEIDPSDLTPRQLATLKYREKNREKINEKNLNHYHQKKKENQ